jgi:hypothetical protein
MTRIVTAPLRGRLGNLLFQIGATYTYAELSGRKAYFYPGNNDLNSYYENIFRKVCWVNQLPRFSVLRHPFEYVPIPPLDHVDSLFIDGSYLQSEKYLNYKLVKDLFEITPELKEYILNKYPDIQTRTSIHVRRGDYLHPNCHGHHPILPIDTYYNKAIEMFPDEKFIIFSDDIEWCKQNFNIADAIFVSEKDYVELYMMSLCKNNIIANSTFSWWGAYLNENPDKKVGAPDQWFGLKSPNNYKDIVPDSWIKIKY